MQLHWVCLQQDNSYLRSLHHCTSRISKVPQQRSPHWRHPCEGGSCSLDSARSYTDCSDATISNTVLNHLVVFVNCLTSEIKKTFLSNGFMWLMCGILKTNFIRSLIVLLRHFALICQGLEEGYAWMLITATIRHDHKRNPL